MAENSAMGGNIRPLSMFSEGAITVKDQWVASQLSRLAATYPVASEHRKAIRQLGGDFTYVAETEHWRGTWLTLVRFGQVIEGQLGLGAEVPLVYDSHNDLQQSFIYRLKEYLEALPSEHGHVSDAISLWWSLDPRTEDKLLDWSRPTRTLIPMPRTADVDVQTLHKTLRQQIYSRDVYSQKGAVSGEGFYGRRSLMSAVQGSLDDGRVVGIFGLRKTGKSSVLHQMRAKAVLADRDTGKKRAFVYQDLEDLSDFSGDPVVELVEDLRVAVWASLKEAGLRTSELAELPANPSIVEFRQALTSLLKKLKPGEGLVLMLDEIEHLCNPEAESQSEGNAAQKKVPQLFGSLRKLAEERPNFDLIIAGLASSSVEASLLYGRENPLFDLAAVQFMSPFSPDEGADLLKGLGKQVGLSWDEDAIGLAMAESGGSAMLLRQIGSEILAGLDPNRIDHFKVDQSAVRDVLQSWRESVANKLQEISHTLRRFYPKEYQMLEVLREDPAKFAEIAYEEPARVSRLKKIGVIEQVGDSWVGSRPLQLSWEIDDNDTAATAEVVGGYDSVKGVNSDELIKRGEQEAIEFKQTALCDPATGERLRSLKDVVVKTVAGFLNAAGGVLLIGVADNGQVTGIEGDMALTERRKGDVDEYQVWLTNVLVAKLDGRFVAHYVGVEFDTLEGRQICRVNVEPSLEPCYINGDTFVARIGNTTQTFNTKQAHEYISDHW